MISIPACYVENEGTKGSWAEMGVEFQWDTAIRNLACKANTWTGLLEGNAEGAALNCANKPKYVPRLVEGGVKRSRLPYTRMTTQ